jgi:anti-sigma factor RsiW
VNGVLNAGCSRAQAWASLELDGELSQLECALLEAHLRRCAACAVRVADLRALTVAIREAPLEQLSEPAFTSTPAREASRPRTLAVRIAVAATLAALAGGLGVVAGTLSSGSGEPTAPEPELVLLNPDGQRDVGRVRTPPETPETRLGGV